MDSPQNNTIHRLGCNEDLSQLPTSGATLSIACNDLEHLEEGRMGLWQWVAHACLNIYNHQNRKLSCMQKWLLLLRECDTRYLRYILKLSGAC